MSKNFQNEVADLENEDKSPLLNKQISVVS